MKHANIAVFVPHAGCPHTCAFCNQKIISGSSKPPTAQDVDRVLSGQADLCRSRPYPTQLAFFGGSFTAIDRDYMISLLEAAYPYIKSGVISGIRCSTRPDCIDSDVLRLLRKYGVEAIELGAQSMNDRVLELNGRGHTAQDVRDAAAMIHSSGIELGLQMMTGLYGDDDGGAEYTARELAAAEPATVRIYPTVVLRGTVLDALMTEGKYNPPGVEQSVSLCARLLQFFEDKAIKVIKLGLHAETGVERDMTGGCYHPAFRELCESRIYLDKAAQALKGRDKSPVYTLTVGAGELSKLIGQKKYNIKKLNELGYRVKAAESPLLSARELRVE